ncbi:AbfB domain-containing protein [Streptomyces actinomycinicus]|uniref:AbfB domain-containing protein n=1 Tax=Streptomyces actinomycinicus TaxID=1695166 RepID=A0A937ER29_9ACTN|nr:AbfB domain-containing protein [Streptomyces actinomycinicus]MBL1086444.1 AbfB domain-containing protein [Streptomyces actinomycinicus]
MPENSPLVPQQPDGDPRNAATRPARRRILRPAGVLALAAVAAGVTAMAVHGGAPQTRATPQAHRAPTANAAPADGGPGEHPSVSPSDDSPPGASPSARANAPGKRGGPASPTAPRAVESPVIPTAQPTPTTAKRPFPRRSSPQATGRATAVRSLNRPDGYWRLGGDDVRLGPVTSAAGRRAATFKLVKGLADAHCYSFATADGRYLRTRNSVLRAGHDDGSRPFARDATFCPHPSAFTGATALESAAHPGRFLRHQNSGLRLDPYRDTGSYRADSAFLLVDGAP